ncbi:undecaprenyl-diphosphate phosphatase [Ectobacillus panaciterrae]|uniref:undecaprenyl-diphosphate phosphatase n=1 Tax=Ectobacillus panaciterrae TaxID=363872 RepID=UPI0003FE1AE9|nr:undecaprenyl-diphosphate phosphatase [Ectobacillus panaciterrae]
MNILQTLIFAIIQGITELFPISSVAHGVLTPYVFHWNLDPEFLKEHFLPYVVMLHLGTAVALFVFFWREWFEIIRSIFTGSKKVLLLVIFATLPAAVIGVVLEKPLRHIFSNVTSAAIFLIINGFFLFFGEKLRSKGNKDIEDLSIRQAVIIGLFQSLALIPGFSRSGSSMTAGFWMGLKHEASARFAMLLATPIIAGASILEVPKILKSGTHGLLQMSLLGGLMSGIFAFLSVWILMKWFKTKEINAMRPFSYYCWVVGVLVLVSQWM